MAYNRLTRKTKSGRHQLSLYDELHEFLDEVDQNVYKSKEEALDKAADFFLERIAADSPVSDRDEKYLYNTARVKDSWERNSKEYTNVRYIYNTALTPGRIPVANLVEFSTRKNAKPFIRPCFEKNKEKIVNIIIGGIKPNE